MLLAVFTCFLQSGRANALGVASTCTVVSWDLVFVQACNARFPGPSVSFFQTIGKGCVGGVSRKFEKGSGHPCMLVLEMDSRGARITPIWCSFGGDLMYMGKPGAVSLHGGPAGAVNG